MTTKQYDRLSNGPINAIDAAIWSGDTFHNRENIANFRLILERWKRGLEEAEYILNEIENEQSK